RLRCEERDQCERLDDRLVLERRSNTVDRVRVTRVRLRREQDAVGHDERVVTGVLRRDRERRKERRVTERLRVTKPHIDLILPLDLGICTMRRRQGGMDMPFRRTYERGDAVDPVVTDDAVEERRVTDPTPWSPAQIIGLIVGIGFTVLGIAAVATTGFHTDHIYTPHDTVWRLSHSPLLAVCEIGFGVLM